MTRGGGRRAGFFLCAGMIVANASGGIVMGQLEAAPLDHLRGQNRVIVMFAGAPDEAALARQQRLLSDAAAGLLERDLVVISASKAAVVVDGIEREDLDAARLRQAYEVPRQGFQLILIGKDGGVKRRSAEPVAVDDLFALIDSMPMRRREMRERTPRAVR